MFGISIGLSLLNILPFIGAIIAFVVSIWISIIWLYVLPLIADQGLTFMGAAGKSNQMVKSAGWWWTFGMVILLGIAAIVVVVVIVIVAVGLGRASETAGHRRRRPAVPGVRGAVPAVLDLLRQRALRGLRRRHRRGARRRRHGDAPAGPAGSARLRYGELRYAARVQHAARASRRRRRLEGGGRPARLSSAASRRSRSPRLRRSRVPTPPRRSPRRRRPASPSRPSRRLHRLRPAAAPDGSAWTREAGLRRPDKRTGARGRGRTPPASRVVRVDASDRRSQTRPVDSPDERIRSCGARGERYRVTSGEVPTR